MDHLVSLLPGTFSPNAKLLQDLFDEYEEGITDEAILVKDVDKYELLVQAIEYERDAVNRGDKLDGVKDLTSFFGARHELKTDLVKGWADEVMKERERLWRRPANDVNSDSAV